MTIEIKGKRIFIFGKFKDFTLKQLSDRAKAAGMVVSAHASKRDDFILCSYSRDPDSDFNFDDVCTGSKYLTLKKFLELTT